MLPLMHFRGERYALQKEKLICLISHDNVDVEEKKEFFICFSFVRFFLV